jgi:hypothetical protein
MRQDSEKPDLETRLFRAFGASVPIEMCSQFSKLISDTGDPKLICKGGARNAVECVAQPVRDPGMIDDVPPSVYNIFAFAILTRV